MIKIRNKKKWITIFLTCVFLFLIIYYLSFGSLHLRHECSGTGCKTCHELHVAETALNQLSTILIYISIIYLLFTTFKKYVVHFSCSFLERNLIRDKVRLDD